jgi:hypothetical protein
MYPMGHGSNDIVRGTGRIVFKNIRFPDEQKVKNIGIIEDDHLMKVPSSIDS